MPTDLARFGTPDTSYEQLLALAGTLVTTGFLLVAIKTPAQALAIILTGRELGIGPMQALRCINIIQGKPVLGADLQLALFKRAGGHAEFVALTGERAELRLQHTNGDQHTEVYTLADAKLAGLLEKDNWRKFTRAMLRSRVITAGLKSIGYEPTAGVYDLDELEPGSGIPSVLVGEDAAANTVGSAGDDHDLSVPPIPVPPAGYDDWLADLESVVEEGTARLKAAWKDSKAAYRIYLTSYAAARWDALKEKAERVATKDA